MDVTVIILSGFTFIWTIISFFLLNQQNKELQYKQTQFEKEVFSYRKQFEIEFEIYRELSLRLLKLFYSVNNLYPTGFYYEPKDHDEVIKKRKELYKDAVEQYNLFIDALFSNAAFINKEIYDEFEKIRQKIIIQIGFYPDFRIYENQDMIEASKEDYRNSWKKTGEIDNDRKAIIEKIRTYLNNYKGK